MASINRLSLIALVLQSVIQPIQTRNVSCHDVERVTKQFDTYNSTKSYSIPALKFDENEGSGKGQLIEDKDRQWKIISRTEGGQFTDPFNYIYLDTSDSNVTNMGGCFEGTSVSTLGTLAFSGEVLRRSVDDNGDCKTMLGEKCVAALEKHYYNEGMREMNGGSCRNDWNTTIPTECANELTDGEPHWLGTTARTGYDFKFGWEDEYNDLECNKNDTFKPLSNSIHTSLGIGQEYNISVRFPRPVFLTFWPNKTRTDSNQNSEVHWAIRCVRPDEIQEGSEVPASAEEILKGKGVKFDEDAKKGVAAAWVQPFARYTFMVTTVAFLLL